MLPTDVQSGPPGQGVAVVLEPFKAQQRIDLGEGVEFDPSSDELCRGGRVFKLERIPAAVLLLLVERAGQVVQREEIVGRVWGKDVFLDTDNSINSAIRKIRQALKDDSESPRFIQTISGRGYRFLGPAEPDQKGLIPSPTVEASALVEARAPLEETPSSGSTAGRRIWHRTRLLMLAIAVLAIAATAFLLGRNVGKPTAHSPIRSLAVLPLQNLSGDSQDYLADGMTESIIGRLSALRELRVISRTSIMRFKDTKLTVPEIARQLNVDAIVEGSVIRAGNRIRVHAQLIRAATDAHFWSESYDREMKDLLSLQSDVAQSIADKVEVTITEPERQRLASVPPVASEVYEKFLKGQFAFERSNDRADTEKSIEFFQKAIEKDPSFAPAYLGLANAYFYLSSIFIGVRPEEVRPKSVAAVRKALELDPQFAPAHLRLGQLQMLDWHWAEAETEFRRALEINPNSGAAYDCMAYWLVTQGRTDEALEWAHRGRELDPFEVSDVDLTWFLFLGHRFPEAIQEARIAVSLEPNGPGALWFLGYALIANGQPEEAIAPMEKALANSNRSPGVLGVLVRAYAHSGRRAEAVRVLDELKRQQKSGYVPAGAFVNAYLGLGETDSALAALEEAYKEHSVIVQYLKVHPHFDPIRNDPRFRDIVHRAGLD